ncbi:hypothetical protein BH23BAC4_BH23BAC4_10430 [soil metagenome]
MTRRCARLALALLLSAGVFHTPARAQFGLGNLPGLPIDTLGVAFNPVNLLAGGLGITNIRGGQGEGDFLLMTLQPELDLRALGVPDLGIGIFAPLRYQIGGGDGETSGFRTEDYDSFEKVLSAIRYVRFGQKDADQVLYARFGAIDQGRIGYGQQVYLYKNEIGQDARRRGAALDLDAGIGGIETLVGTFTNPGVFAGRAYLRPLRILGGGETGLNSLTVGVTLAGDMNAEGGFVNSAAPGQPFVLPSEQGLAPFGSDGFTLAEDQGRLTSLGVDLGMRIASSQAFFLSAYADFASMLRYGYGGGAGLGLTLAPPGLVRLDARLELRYLGSQYLPTYFNAFYEVDRIRQVGGIEASDANGEPVLDADGNRLIVPIYQTKRNEMLGQTSPSGGVFAGVSGTLLNLLRLEGTYQQLFSDGGAGWLHMSANLGRFGADRLFVRATYDLWNIGGRQEAFQMADNRTALLQAEGGLRLLENLGIGLLFERAFAPVFDDAGGVTSFLSQDRIEPRVQYILPF